MAVSASVLLSNISVLNLANRPRRTLKRYGVHNIAALTLRTEGQLVRMTGMGQKGVDEIKIKLEELGLSLKSER